jgi:hypothetical protein
MLGVNRSLQQGINCIFDPVEHAYTQDLVRIPSTTEILRLTGISDDFDGIPKSTIEYARERGSYVDACLRALDAGELEESSVHQEAQGYLAAYKLFKTERGFNTHAWGQPRVAVKNGMKFGLTEDITGWMNSKPWLIDVKCTAKMPESVTVQTAAYACGLGQAVVSDRGIETYDFVKGYTVNDLCDPAKLRTVPWCRGALQLFPDGTFNFEPHKDDEGDFMEWISALYLVTRRNNRRAK